MNKKSTIIFSICMLLLGVFVSNSRCESVDQQVCTKMVTGSVASIDWVGNKLAIRTSDGFSSDEITVLVPGDAAITKGTDNISLADINVSDNVVVEYYCNTFAGLKARTITVNE